MFASLEYQNLLNDKENIWEWGIGSELQFLEMTFLRLGYHERHPLTDKTFIGKTFETGATHGFGLKYH